MNRYSARWFRRRHAKTKRSAELLFPHVLNAVRPTSIVELGCGDGSWLQVAQDWGCEVVVGVDGYQPPRDSAPRHARFLQWDLNSFVGTELADSFGIETFDLAVCLETAEHLPAASAEKIVQALVNLAPTVLFGAAIPHQGGTGHIFERRQSFWAELFARHGYFPFYAWQQCCWTDERVAAYYLQNTYIYSRDINFGMQPVILDVVHPRTVEPSLRRILRLALGLLRRR